MTSRRAQFQFDERSQEPLEKLIPQGRVTLIPGSVFVHPYPFVRSTYMAMDEEGSCEIPCWRPGAVRLTGPYNEEWTADGVGRQLLEVVSVHKPGKYQPRVFYTQRWIDPAGKAFGKGLLRCCLLRVFLRRAQGYGYPYTVREVAPSHRGGAICPR